MKNRIEFTTPVGRIVRGSVSKPKTTDADGRPLLVKNGPNVGKPRVEFFFALAIPKTDPAWQPLQQQISKAAVDAFGPNITMSPTFAWKITDGDSTTPNEKGRRPCDVEGYAGHWVLNFSSGSAPKTYRMNERGQIVACDATEIKTGYRARVNGNAASNDSATKPGMYLNHNMVLLVAVDNEITTGTDAATAFGAPMAPAVDPVVTTAFAPSAPTPHTQFLAGPPTPPVTPERFTLSGSIYTRDQLRAAGWQDANIDALPRA